LSLPSISGRKLIKALAKIGFKLVSIKGSHAKLKKNGKTTIIPLHREIAKGTLLSILRQAGISKQELLKLLKDPQHQET